MQNSSDSLATDTRAAADILSDAWKTGLSEISENVSIDVELVTSDCHEDADALHYFNSLLTNLVEALGGERAFLFRLGRSRGNDPELLGCAASIDLDGDAVSNPDRKVPANVLVETATRAAPTYRAWDGNDESRSSSYASLPAISRGECVAVVVIENRFRDIRVTEGTARVATSYLQHLAWQLDLEDLSQENESLWTDLNRLRDEAEASLAQGAVVSSPVRRSKSEGAGKRSGLKGDYSMIVGSSPKIVEILQVIDRISTSVAPVLINGESGTGKELIALAVHTNSPRSDKPFVSENCAAITETLLESELFGYVKGAFTGANKDHKGLFEIADGGTLFLDEVGDMSSSMQKKLLRVLQEGVIRRVGAKEYTPVDVRIISATNKDLLSECRKGNFREDLYYRLNVINLKLPPLRDRKEDVVPLIEFFLEQSAKEHGTHTSVDPNAQQKLVAYAWPGNVRELQNEVKRLCAMADDQIIKVSDLSEALLSGEAGESTLQDWPVELAQMTLREATERLEKSMIQNALNETGGNKSLVAKTLQIPKTSLYNKINKYELT